MKYVIFLLLAGLPLLAQPTGSAEQRREKAEQRWAENKQRTEEQVFENRVSQEVEKRLNTERQAAQTAAIQAQQAAASSFYGGSYGYNRWAPQPVYHMPQDGAVAIGERVSPPENILETGVTCVERLAEKLGPKEAQKFCKDVTKEALEESGNISRSARKAVKAPAILIPRYGW